MSRKPRIETGSEPAAVAPPVDLRDSEAIRAELDRLLGERERLADFLRRLGDISHSINNPLTALLGRLQILRLRSEADPVLRKTVEVLEDSAKRIADYARDLSCAVREGREELLRAENDSRGNPSVATP